MNTKIDKILTIWHKHFEDEEYQYSEFESSDIEYFVGCMLYNHFEFEKALKTMKTIDLSYDFLVSSKESYDEVLSIIKSIKIEEEIQKIKFLQEFIELSKSKYSSDELYLLNRLEQHVNGVLDRFKKDQECEKVDFVATRTKPKNPLLR
ncbi:MAG: hypothetical protein GXO30_06975 [Epsilonproteobacteria bacterium]|nr:hypothetical protein [Campylobacterota bacterium]